MRPQPVVKATRVLALKDVSEHLQLLCAGVCASALALCAELWRFHRARSTRARAAQHHLRWVALSVCAHTQMCFVPSPPQPFARALAPSRLKRAYQLERCVRGDAT
ncbi:Protein of unknown function [Gryllus bimaculatus]|nr:Protein of unknown function [Gryllus bimaculatus]